MEKVVEFPIAVELIPSHDRKLVLVAVRAPEKIAMSLLVPALENFTEQLRKQFMKSAIEVPKPIIIV